MSKIILIFLLSYLLRAHGSMIYDPDEIKGDDVATLCYKNARTDICGQVPASKMKKCQTAISFDISIGKICLKDACYILPEYCSFESIQILQVSLF